ncbi:MAG: glutathione S-transferase [Myxococcota bacterium]
MPQITVHHLDDSRSHRVLWLLEELEVPYELVVHRRDPKTMRAPPALLAVHPLGKAPVVVVDGVVLAESGAILETLTEDLGPQLRPEPGTEAFRKYRYYLHYAEGSLGTPLLVALLMLRVRSAPVPFFIRPIARRIADNLDALYTNPEIERHFAFLEGELQSDFLCGDALTAADIQLSFGVEAAAARGLVGDRPRLRAWLDRLHARPAYRRAVERGGPYAYG